MNWSFETNNRYPKPTCLFIIHEIYYLVYSALRKLQTETLDKVMRRIFLKRVPLKKNRDEGTMNNIEEITFIERKN